MSGLKEKYKANLEKIIAAKDPSAANVIDDAIVELRLLNEKIIQKRDDLRGTSRGEEMRRSFDQAASELKAEEAQRIRATREAYAARSFVQSDAKSNLVAASLSFISMVFIIITLQYIGLIDIAFGSDAQRRINLDSQFLADQSVIPIANDYLIAAANSVRQMQSSNPAKLEKLASKNFVSLQEINPELHKVQPKQLGKYTTVIVKADRNAYKVLMNWPLCSAAKSIYPQLVDPVRTSDGNHCSFFGYWNDAGEQF